MTFSKPPPPPKKKGRRECSVFFFKTKHTLNLKIGGKLRVRTLKPGMKFTVLLTIWNHVIAVVELLLSKKQTSSPVVLPILLPNYFSPWTTDLMICNRYYFNFQYLCCIFWVNFGVFRGLLMKSPLFANPDHARSRAGDVRSAYSNYVRHSDSHSW